MRNKLYGYRTLSRECPSIFGAFVEDFVAYGRSKKMKHLDVASARRLSRAARPARVRRPAARAPKHERWYCDGPGRVGFYNNWFVTKIDWWISHERSSRMISAFDRSNLIFTRRSNDLIFQTAVIKLLMPRHKRTRYTDFTYQHHTVQNGAVTYGGLETGWNDAAATAALRRYRDTWTADDGHRELPPLSVRPCAVQSDDGGPFRPTFFISPGRDASENENRQVEPAAARPRFESPYCGPDGRTPVE